MRISDWIQTCALPIFHHHIEKGPTGPTITYGFIRDVPGAGEVHYVIATDERLLDETIASFTRELTLWLTALAGALAATGFFVVTFGLRPLDSLADAPARLRSGNASRLQGDSPTKIDPFVPAPNPFHHPHRQTAKRPA